MVDIQIKNKDVYEIKTIIYIWDLLKYKMSLHITWN